VSNLEISEVLKNGDLTGVACVSKDVNWISSRFKVHVCPRFQQQNLSMTVTSATYN